MPYCTTDDLLIGDIRTSTRLDPQKYVNDAADEIDSKIGFLYETPIPTDVGSTTPRPVILLLKRINSHLASGRLILAATIAAEDQELNAYGRTLVDEAEKALDAIATGLVLLDGVTAGTMTQPQKPYPLISNGDTESAVDAFYNRVVNPNYVPVQVISPYWGY